MIPSGLTLRELELLACLRTAGLLALDRSCITGQAGALRLAVARALVKLDESHRRKLRDLALLTRDARAVERKKPGRPKARKKFQFSKR